MRTGSARRILASVAATGAVVLASTSCGEDAPARPTASGVEEALEPTTEAEAAVQEAPEPDTETTKVEKREPIAFGSQTRRTSDLKKGVTRVAQRGSNGVRLKVWRVTTTDGEETSRELLRSVVVRRPVPRITLVGTYVAPPRPQPSCDPNYSDGCVPIASDVDCGGGSGNGPEYVYGAVRIVGSDIYDLDADGDGWGCD